MSLVLVHLSLQAELCCAPGALQHRAVRGPPVKELNTMTRQKRMKFASSNLMKRWDRVMFTDRSKFHFLLPRVKHQACWLGEAGPERAGS